MKHQILFSSIPGPSFGSRWSAMLWEVMARTTKGYRRYSLKHTGKDNDRRRDKLDAPDREMERYRQRYSCHG